MAILLSYLIGANKKVLAIHFTVSPERNTVKTELSTLLDRTKYFNESSLSGLSYDIKNYNQLGNRRAQERFFTNP